MKVRYTVTADFEIEDKLIKEWAKDGIKYNYPECIEHNIEECFAYHFDVDYIDIDNTSKTRIHLINCNDNLDEIITMVKIRGEKLLTNKPKVI